MLRPLTTIVCGALLAMGGCVTMNEGDCRYADWFELGRRDGARGHAWQQLVRHRKSCNEYGLEVDERHYREGRDAGLLEYCTPNNGWRTGLRGGSYKRVCPADLEGAFLDGYELGAEIREVRSRYLKPEFPVSTLIQVSGYAGPQYLIEIEAIAVLPDD